MTILATAPGGALGSVFRYVFGGAVQRFAATGLPVGTLVVNIVGCLIVGMLVSAADAESRDDATNPALKRQHVSASRLHT
jgi:CrcB protein